MSEKMRAVDIRGGTGDADALFISSEVEKPKPGHGQALIKVKAFGLNRMDLLQRRGTHISGLYPVPPQGGSTLGVEFSGIVEEIGKGDEDGVSERFQVGDEVFGLAYGGAYAEYVALSTKMLLHKPTHLSWEEAAGIPEVFITATQALFIIGEFTAGKSVLWHAGASSVSIAGTQLSKVAGASEIYATVGTDEKVAFCEKLGVTKAFNYKKQNWAREILEATKSKGVDIVIDMIGADYFSNNLEVAARDGHIVNLAALSGSILPAGVDIGAFVRKRIRFEGSSLRSRDPDYQGRLRDRLESFLPQFEDGTLKIFIEKVFPWEQVIEAHKLMESNKTMGKLICTID